MRSNVKTKMEDLQKRALVRKLSCPNAKSKEDVFLEKENFNHIKKELYSYIGGNKRWS